MRKQCVYRSKFESWHVDNRKRVKFRWQASLCELFYKSGIYNLSHLNRYVYVLLMLPHNSVEKQRIVVFGEGHNWQQLHEEIKNLISVEISRVESERVFLCKTHARTRTHSATSSLSTSGLIENNCISLSSGTVVFVPLLFLVSLRVACFYVNHPYTVALIFSQDVAIVSLGLTCAVFIFCFPVLCKS